ncbi:N-acetylmuramoyl-L-alanine amidase [Flavobacteriaceae bacterium R38]|nr:N-acetylmuramoyl-L-alanine amidase [Flavobacteriaceae bacterium R38]
MKRFFRKILIFTIIIVVLSSFGYIKNQSKKKKFTIVLDAGHGGKDPGKVAKVGKNRYFEKDVALKMILLIGKELEKNDDINVIYTRKDDTFVDLFVRGKIANDANADLFVSLHCNAHTSQAYGSETYVLGLHANKQNFEVAKAENEAIYLEDDYETNYANYDINSPESVIGLTIMQEEFLNQSIVLAAMIQENFEVKLKRKNRGVKQAGFIVLHQTFMPSVLIETGFITNDKERQYLRSSKGQQEMSKSVVNAIMGYKKRIEENVGDDFSFELEKDSVSSVENDIDDVKEDVVNRDNNEELNPIPDASPIIFKVQISAGTTQLELKAYNFKGLNPITREKEEGIYRYFYGELSNFEDAKKFQEEAKEKGYRSAFIVAYKKDKRIPIKEALKSISN